MSVVAGLAACCATLGAPLASAADLKGSPFLIDPDFEGQRLYASLFPNGGGFGASLASDTDGDLAPDTLSYKAFDGKGKTVVKKSLVLKGKKGELGVVSLSGAGGLDLDGKEALVGYVDLRKGKKGLGGLYAQVMKGKKSSGQELTLDTATKGVTDRGFIVPLADKRGLAFWTTTDGNGVAKSGARFVQDNGKAGKNDIDLTRKNSVLSGVTSFGSGFVALQREFKDLTDVAIYGQVYDAKGDKDGAEGEIAATADSALSNTLTILGLDGGKIVSLNAIASGGSAELTAQVYDGGWKKIGGAKVVMTDLAGAYYASAALPGGDFLIAAVVGTGDDGRIEFRRFGANLKQSGQTAKTKAGADLIVNQLLTLKNGDAVALYEAADHKLKAQIVKP